MRDASEGGARIGIILNGSPLFTGGTGSGESEIRRYILEADLLEAIVALPNDMCYNTGIATYVWVLSNKKSMERKTGARGLRTIVENVLLDTMYEIPSAENITAVVVDEAVIMGDSKPYLVYENEKKLASSES